MVELNNNIRLIVIDSFCGAGGVTEGFHRAVDEHGNKICKVIIGINHDEKAIESHAANHPDTIHFIEDFTTLDANRLLPIVESNRKRYPNAKVLFWASAECTHHSKAKGGLPRNADSRSLPEHIERYVKVINPDIIGVENVVEFLDWGPLDENGKPIKELKGIYYSAWRDNLIGLDYLYDFRTLNAADFGAYTSRVRYFGIFAKEANNIAFPVQTHSKNVVNGLLKWNAVKEVLNLDIEGDSIFDREKPLVDATLERIIAGIERFVVNKTEDVFVSRYSTVSPDHTIDHHHILTAYYGNGYNTSVEDPAGTVTTKDRFALVTSKFMDQQYGMSKPAHINQPAGTLTANPKLNIV